MYNKINLLYSRFIHLAKKKNAKKLITLNN